jgi:hypothetical protein
MDYPQRKKFPNTGKKSKKTIKPSKKKLKKQNDLTKLPAGLRIDTTTSAYGDAGMGRPYPFYKKKPKGMKTGGVCKGAGAAIKGTNFKGVF